MCVREREGGRKMTKRRKKKDKTKGMRIGVMYIYVNFPLTVYIDHDAGSIFYLRVHAPTMRERKPGREVFGVSGN